MRAAVIGSGPNGLAAALVLARAGADVTVYEAAERPGGGTRTDELTLPGFRHDVCSTVQTLVQHSPLFRSLDLAGLGARLRTPPIAFAHPLDDGRAALACTDLDRTLDSLGPDGRAYRRLVAPLVDRFGELCEDVLSDLRRPPQHVLLLARFGLPGLAPATTLARTLFRADPARALLAGAAAHSTRRLTAPLTAAFALILAASAHATGWPVIEGGSERLTEALVTELTSHGVRFELDHRVASLDALPARDVTMLDLTPRQVLDIAGDELPPRYARALRRFRYGPGVFKIDYALREPVPWTNPGCRQAGTVHVGGSLAEIAASEAEVESGRHSERPFVLTVQAGLPDPSRGQTLWAYCHVPAGSTLDRSDAVEAQLERFAPGFRDVVLARHVRTAAQYEQYNSNLVGGDISAGRAGLFQTVLGPVPRWSRYRVPLPGTYLCSASTPPGGGVHGMCGMNAARAALRAISRS
jgi:phytoene dehydrogenase-like protein